MSRTPVALESCVGSSPGRDGADSLLMTASGKGVRGLATVINVGGTSRSGSTALHLMLGNGPNTFACGEVSNWFYPVMRHHFDAKCPCGSEPCPIWMQLEGATAASFYNLAVDRLGVDFVVDSSKQIMWLVAARKYAAQGHLRSINIVSWKDPVELAYSFWKRGHSEAVFWSQFKNYYPRFAAVGLPLLAVNNGDLSRAPADKLAEVCRAVGMEYFPGKERFWEAEQHQLFGSPSVRRPRAARAGGEPESRLVEEFEPIAASVAKRVADDAEVRSVITMLRNADVSVVAAGEQVVQDYSPRRVYPLWFYRQKIRRAYRRRRPRALTSSGGSQKPIQRPWKTNDRNQR